MIRDLARKSRSWRGYDESRKVSREELVEMVECARLCPSSVNMQPLKYYLAWEEEQVKKIQPLTKWARALQPMELPHKGHCPTAFIVICQDTALQPSIPRFQKDIGIVAQTMLLAATEMGLGGCMISNYDAGQVREALELPEHLMPVLIVAIVTMLWRMEGSPVVNYRMDFTDVKEDGDINYYRDENDVHYVPKRSLEDLIINK